MCEQEDVKARRARDLERWHRRSEARQRNPGTFASRAEPPRKVAPGRTRCEPCLEKRRRIADRERHHKRTADPGVAAGTCVHGAASFAPEPGRSTCSSLCGQARQCGKPCQGRQAPREGTSPGRDRFEENGSTSARDAAAFMKSGYQPASAASAAVPPRGRTEPPARLAPESIEPTTSSAMHVPRPRVSSTGGAIRRRSGSPGGRAAADGPKPAAPPVSASVAGTAGPKRAGRCAGPAARTGGRQRGRAGSNGKRGRPLRQVRRALGWQGALRSLRRRQGQAVEAQLRGTARG